MCLSVAYLVTNGEKEKVMSDVAFLEAENNGFMLVTLLGERKFVEGDIQSIDFMNDHSVVFTR